MTKGEIKGRQGLLLELGFDPGPIDGIDGRQTQAALRALREALAAPERDIDLEDPNTQLLIKELETDEGKRLHAYQDSLGYWTIGIGRLIDKRKGGGITDAEAHYLKHNDVRRVRKELDRVAPWWRSLDPVRQRAVQNMAFQMGSGVLKSGLAVDLIKEGKYAEAATSLRAWVWAQQTPARAARVIHMIEHGEVSNG